MKLRIPILLVLLTALSACSHSREIRQQANLFGTRVTVVIDDNRPSAQVAMHEVMAEFKTLDGILPPATAKPMRRTNVMLDSGSWFSVNPSIYPLIQQAKLYYRRSHGLFNPAILGALKQLRGDYATPGTAAHPQPKAMAELLRNPPSMKKIEVDGIRMRNPNPHLRLDFGLLMYGYAVDAEIAHLRQLGIHNARVSVGPVTRVLGTRQGRPWRVRKQGTAPGLPLTDGEAVCQIGAADVSWHKDLLDPRTGNPPRGPAAVRVIADNGADASVGCTVLTLAGPGGWRQAARNLGLNTVAIQMAHGPWFASPAMASRQKQARVSGKTS